MIPLSFIKDKQKHIISIVGAGGKTTVMYELAAYYASQGKKTAIMTTTHILKPDSAALLAHTLQELCMLWKKGSYGVVGQEEAGTGKLIAPANDLYQELLKEADIVLCEADGAKHLPLKVPRSKEPVIPEKSDIVLGVVGLDCLGKTYQEACFGLEEACALLAVQPQEIISLEKIVQVISSQQGLSKCVGERAFYVVLNKANLVEDKEQVRRIYSLLMKWGLAKDHIWVRW